MTRPVLIVVGSREWTWYTTLAQRCEALAADLQPVAVWSGGASGADSHAESWATLSHRLFRRWPADWNRFGRSAGFRRTAEMLNAAPAGSVVAAFVPHTLAECRGTAFTVTQARRRGLRVWLVDCLGGRWISA